MSAISPAEIEDFLRTLSGFDLIGAADAIRDGNIDGIIQTGEEAAAIAAVFLPPAAYIKTGLIVLAMIVDGYRSGAIKSAAVEDPALQRVTGSHAR